MQLSTPKKVAVTKQILSAKKLNELVKNETWINANFWKTMTPEELMTAMDNLVRSSEITVSEKDQQQRKPWWNADCSKALAKTFRFTLIYRRVGSQKHWDALQNSQREFKNTVKKAKTEGWKNFCSTITGETSISDVWKMARIFKGKRVNTRNEDSSGWIEEFMNKHSQPAPCNQLSEEIFDNRCKFFDTKISPTVVQQKIINLKKSAAGLDKINNLVLKHLPPTIIEIMTDCFNDIVRTGVIPEQWKLCKVIPLQKPGKPTGLASSKRPISIFGKVRRLFESAFLDSFDRWAEHEKILSPTQYGFRKGKSTRDCVAILMTDIKNAFQEKKMVGAVFLDITAAYDNVNIERFVQYANYLGLPMNISTLLWNMYSKKINSYRQW